MNVIRTLLTLASLAFLTGPATVARAAEKSPPPAPAAATAPTPATAYRLELQDKLLFSIVEDPIQTATPDEVYVDALGQIHFRISRGFDDTISLDARDKALADIKAELQKKLEEEYYQHATIDLMLKEQTRRNGQVLFFGAVRGNFLALVAGEPRTIFEGVYQIGVTEFANLKKVKLSRLNPATSRSETRIIDLDAIKNGDRSKDVRLQDGDRVEVPEKKIVF